MLSLVPASLTFTFSLLQVGTGIGGTGAAPVVAQSASGVFDPTTALIAVAIAIVLIVVLFPIARAMARRMEKGSPGAASTGASDDRMHRLEQSVEALTLEMERISESQRYTTKLLTERLPIAARIPQPGQGDKTLL